MVLLNLVFILAAMGYFSGALRQYFSGPQLNRYFLFTGVFFMAVTASYWWTRPILGTQLFFVCGIIFHFCSGVRTPSKRGFHFGLLFLLMILLIYQWNHYNHGSFALVENWRANFNRMIFNFPLERVGDGPVSKGTGNGAFPNSAIFFLSLLCLYPWLKKFRNIPMELKMVVSVTWIGLFVRSFFYAEMDATILAIPGLIFMICYTLSITFD